MAVTYAGQASSLNGLKAVQDVHWLVPATELYMAMMSVTNATEWATGHEIAQMTVIMDLEDPSRRGVDLAPRDGALAHRGGVGAGAAAEENAAAARTLAPGPGARLAITGARGRRGQSPGGQGRRAVVPSDTADHDHEVAAKMEINEKTATGGCKFWTKWMITSAAAWHHFCQYRHSF